MARYLQIPCIAVIIFAVAGCTVREPVRQDARPNRRPIPSPTANEPALPPEKPHWVRLLRFTSQDQFTLERSSNPSGISCATTKPNAVIIWSRINMPPGGMVAGGCSFELDVASDTGSAILVDAVHHCADPSGYFALGDPGNFYISPLTWERFAIEVYESSSSDGNPDELPPIPSFSDLEMKTSDDEDRILNLEKQEQIRVGRIRSAEDQYDRQAERERQMRSQRFGGGGARVYEVPNGSH